MRDAKPVRWVGSARDDLRRFPAVARRNIGLAQRNDKHPTAKPLKGFGGAGVLEIVENCEGGTCRAVYTVRFSDAVYVLHAFVKKSKHGIKTPKHEIDLLKQRLRQAEDDSRSKQGNEEGTTR